MQGSGTEKGVPPAKPLPELDHRLMELPSDRITLGQMRIKEPELFTRESLRAHGLSEAEALSLYSIELRLAERAFASAAGVPDPYPKTSRSWQAEILNEAYVRYGVSRGIHETEELMRSMEAGAAAQGERHRGRAP